MEHELVMRGKNMAIRTEQMKEILDIRKADIDRRRIQVCRLRIQIYEKTGEKEKYVQR